MLDQKKIEKLRKIALDVDDVISDVNGSVTFHLSKHDYPKVEVRMCNITEAKK